MVHPPSNATLAGESSQKAVGRPMEILLVEDSLVDARLTMGALRNGQVQHRLTYVRDGEEALEFLRREGPYSRAPRPDLILLDLMLPKVSGLEILAIVKADEALGSIPVVILTASSADEDKLNCEDLQVDSYITKPVNLEKFLDTVRKLKRFWLTDVILPAVD